MIAYLHGKVTYKDGAQVHIECAGVGYCVRASLHTLSQLNEGDTIKLPTHMIVREDAQLLYGFFVLDEKICFELLLTVNGVGANMALAILSTLKVYELVSAIQQGDRKRLIDVRGVGTKTAERILLELQDRLPKDLAASGWASGTSSGTAAGASDGPVQKGSIAAIRNEALLALQTLGLPRKTVEPKIDEYIRKSETIPTVEELIRFALHR